jgi:hypothetical protein
MSAETLNQQIKLLKELRHGPVTTLTARELFIMHPAGRIKELKSKGHNIITRMIEASHGSKRKIAQYVLLAGDTANE